MLMSQDRLPITHILAVSLGTIVACAALGAFGGCDIDLLRSARGAGSDRPYKMLLCMLIGLFLGLGVVLWRRPWRLRLSDGMRFVLQAGYAIAWLGVGGLSLYGAVMRKPMTITYPGADFHYSETAAFVSIGAILALLMGCSLLALAIIRWRRSASSTDGDVAIF
jgi:hypothetical protein